MLGKGQVYGTQKVPLPSSLGFQGKTSLTNSKDAQVFNSICSRTEELVKKLRYWNRLEDACSLMGLITAYGQQLQKSHEFFRKLMYDIYTILEKADERLMRIVLLHLVELVAADWQLNEAALNYYQRKAVLPESCEDAFNAALNFVKDVLPNELDVSSAVQQLDIKVRSPSPPVTIHGAHMKIKASIPEVMDKTSNQSDVSPLKFASSCQMSTAEPFPCQKEENNNVEEEALDQVFGKSIEHALLNCKDQVSTAFESTEDLITVEKEEGSHSKENTQILPSVTTLSHLNCAFHEQVDAMLTTNTATVEPVKDDLNTEEKQLKELEKNKAFERFTMVKGDVIVHISSDSKEHVEEVFKVLSWNFSSQLEQQPLHRPDSCEQVYVKPVQITYSRAFLLRCSASSHSKGLPDNWDKISGEFPEICLKQGRMFNREFYEVPCEWSLIKTSYSHSLPGYGESRHDGIEEFAFVDWK